MSGKDCEEALARLHDFLDGELTADRRQQISVHLEECGHCLELYDFEAEVKMALAERCRERLPDGLADRITKLLNAD